MKLLSLFSGIGAFEKALTNLDIDYEVVGFSEIDKWAIESYCAIHGVDKGFNLGDVSQIKLEDVPNADMVTYGFPCQDVSIAGKQAGICETTRSGLLYEAERIIEHIKPKYAIAENVKNLVGKRFYDDFEELLERLDSYGYNNYWQVLNAKDYGIPQNRERVFIVSIRKDVDNGTFEFPKPFELELKLKDMLEDSVEDKYDVTQTYIEYLQPKGNVIGEVDIKGNEQIRRVYSEDGISPTLSTMQGGHREPKIKMEGIKKIKVREATKKGYDIATSEDSINISFPNSKTRRGRVGKGVAQTLDTQCNQAVLQVTKSNLEDYYFPEGHKEYDNYDKSKVDKSKTKINPIQVGFSAEYGNSVSNNEYAYTLRASNPNGILDEHYRIRKLTPLESWRLMGFEDNDYWTARRRLEEVFYNGNDRSNSQMYKQAGNSIVVNVLEEIFKELL